MAYKVFISHKNDQDSNDAGAAIKKALELIGYEVFFDKASLAGGMDWSEEIFQNLTESSVLILIIDSDTAKSDWVQREVDMARALGISILPVVLHGGFDKAKEAFDRFALGTIQLISFSAFRMDESLNEVLRPLKSLTEQTILMQDSLMDVWKSRRTATPFIFKQDSRAVILKHPDIPNIEFCISTGDATNMDGYTILVNTENNYMQMARFFEIKTLSWAIRTRGALLRNNEILLEDTIQDELYENMRKEKYSLPLPDRTVITTSAGKANNYLNQHTNFRHILHVAAVRFNIETGQAEPVGPIKRIIENCFEQVKGMKQAMSEEDATASLNSILFPIFGTGKGGKDVRQSAKEIISCFHEDAARLVGRANLPVSKIGLAVFNAYYLGIVKDAFLDKNFEIVSENK